MQICLPSIIRPVLLFNIILLTLLARPGLAQSQLPVSQIPPTSHSTEVHSGGVHITVESDQPCHAADRLWLISSRRLTSSACRAGLETPQLSVSRLNHCGQRFHSSLDEYLQSIGPSRTVVIYAHGNRLDSGDAISRGIAVYRSIARYQCNTPIDWVIYSWPAEKTGMLIRDFREKAGRCDAHGLYLGWLLKRQIERAVPTAMIGYSFGGRIATGALHAMAGGRLAGRALPDPPIIGANIDVGLIAPAIDSNGLSSRGYHRLATENLDQLLLLYNRRDAVLKRYWLLSDIRSQMAMGYTGPRTYAPRSDGTRVFVTSRDCAPFIGLRHDELDYYQSRCRAGASMATLINDARTVHP